MFKLKRHITTMLILFILLQCSVFSEFIGDDNSLSKVNLDTALNSEEWNVSDFKHVYEVGPGEAYATPNDVPWETLQPSSIVRIHWRSEPYRSKWVITTRGSSAEPVVVVGVPNGNQLPVISGENATTRQGMYYLNEVRSVVKVGNYTGSGDTDRPAYIYIENLDIQNGYPSNSFTDRYGKLRNFGNNAAAVHLEEGEHITIKGCNLHNCGNGIFSGYYTQNVLIRQNYIYNNGVVGRYYEHNTYTESLGITYEYNYFGPLRAGCDGNNLKDRSAGTVIRYNWIESGNRQLDLVNTGSAELFNDPSYQDTFVYGNVLIEPDGAGNSQMIHYGGDGSDTSYFRRGTIHLYHNTLVSTRSGNTTLIRLSSNDVTADILNNIVYTTAGPGRLALTNGMGIVKLKNNWLTEGYRDTFESTKPVILENAGNIIGKDPGFLSAVGQEFELAKTSVCIDKAGELGAELVGYMPTSEYVKHQKGELRTLGNTALDIGAHECLVELPSIPKVISQSTFIFGFCVENADIKK